MHCPHCGAALPDDAQSCPSCGAAIAHRAPPTGPAPHPAPGAYASLARRAEAYSAATQREPGRSWVGLLWGLGAIAVVLFLCVGLGILPSIRDTRELYAPPTAAESEAMRRVETILRRAASESGESHASEPAAAAPGAPRSPSPR